MSPFRPQEEVGGWAGGGLWALMWAVCLHIHQQFAIDSNKPLLACISLLGSPHCQAAKDFRCRLWLHCSRKPGRLYQPRRAALTSCCLSLLGNRRICSPSLQGHSVPFINWVVLSWIGFHSQWQVRSLFFFVRMQNTFFFSPDTTPWNDYLFHYNVCFAFLPVTLYPQWWFILCSALC